MLAIHQRLEVPTAFLPTYLFVFASVATGGAKRRHLDEAPRPGNQDSLAWQCCVPNDNVTS